METNTVNAIQKIVEVIKYPIISDKATRLLESNKYTFLIDKKANKKTIKKAIEYLFNVEVKKVNTLTTAKKKKSMGRFQGWKPQYKKAIITLAEGNSINLFPEI